MLYLADLLLPAEVSGVSRKGAAVQITLQGQNTDDILLALRKCQVSDTQVPILLQEEVPQDLYDEVADLLSRLSQKTGRLERVLLLELTMFKAGVVGKDDLRLVGEKQLIVLRDKMRKEFETEGR